VVRVETVPVLDPVELLLWLDPHPAATNAVRANASTAAVRRRLIFDLVLLLIDSPARAQAASPRRPMLPDAHPKIRTRPRGYAIAIDRCLHVKIL
jgi:hypothetical protein